VPVLLGCPCCSGAPAARLPLPLRGWGTKSRGRPGPSGAREPRKRARRYCWSSIKQVHAPESPILFAEKGGVSPFNNDEQLDPPLFASAKDGAPGPSIAGGRPVKQAARLFRRYKSRGCPCPSGAGGPPRRASRVPYPSIQFKRCPHTKTTTRPPIVGSFFARASRTLCDRQRITLKKRFPSWRNKVRQRPNRCGPPARDGWKRISSQPAYVAEAAPTIAPPIRSC